MVRTVVVLGAGPIGVEFAAHAAADFEVTVVERGDEVGANVRSWSHVQLFSPFKLNCSPAGLSALGDAAVPLPDPEVFPTGAQYLAQYLQPLARQLQDKCGVRFALGQRVVDVGRGTVLKRDDIGGSDGRRKGSKFRVLMVSAEGEESVLEADVVVDATGTYGNGNHVGPGGSFALGERHASQQDGWYDVIPDVLANAASFAAKTTAVIGAGHSAITAIKHLHELTEREGTPSKLVWCARHAADPYAVIADDPLPQRTVLNTLGNALSRGTADASLLETEYLAVDSVVSVKALAAAAGGSERFALEVRLKDGSHKTVGCHNVLSMTGFRPDWDIVRELQLHLCYASEGPMKLAASMMGAAGGGGDCLKQAAPGPQTMLNPEPGFFVLGMKSYGRNSSFLIRVGVEQIGAVLSLLGEAPAL